MAGAVPAPRAGAPAAAPSLSPSRPPRPWETPSPPARTPAPTQSRARPPLTWRRRDGAGRGEGSPAPTRPAAAAGAAAEPSFRAGKKVETYVRRRQRSPPRCSRPARCGPARPGPPLPSPRCPPPAGPGRPQPCPRRPFPAPLSRLTSAGCGGSPRPEADRCAAVGAAVVRSRGQYGNTARELLPQALSR